MKLIEVKNPKWLNHSTPGRTIDLFNEGKLPSSIAGWMIVVSLKHPLRAVYGSDLKAAWHLLMWAIWDKWDRATSLKIFLWRGIRLFRKTERDYWIAQGLPAETLDEDDEKFEADMREAMQHEAGRHDG